MKTRMKKFDEEIAAIEGEISQKKVNIKSSNELIKKYKVQQNNVKNNREFEAIAKEMEMQGLEILASEKRIKDYGENIEEKKKEILDTKVKMEELLGNLNIKKSELDVITTEYEEEEKKLKTNSEKASKTVEERLFTAYRKIRRKAKNGLAVVNVKRNACGGCFAIVPPQRQLEIKGKKEIIVCENCGRILAAVENIV